MTGNKFGQRSKKRLNGCHPDLKLLFYVVNERHNCTIIDGYREKSRQNEYFERGKSQVKYPNSLHNNVELRRDKPTFDENQNKVQGKLRRILKSLATDVCPDPINWSDIVAFKEFAKEVKSIAKELGIHIKWGGDWKNFKDYPHWELDLSKYEDITINPDAD